IALDLLLPITQIEYDTPEFITAISQAMLDVDDPRFDRYAWFAYVISQEMWRTIAPEIDLSYSYTAEYQLIEQLCTKGEWLFAVEIAQSFRAAPSKAIAFCRLARALKSVNPTWAVYFVDKAIRLIDAEDYVDPRWPVEIIACVVTELHDTDLVNVSELFADAVARADFDLQNLDSERFSLAYYPDGYNNWAIALLYPYVGQLDTIWDALDGCDPQIHILNLMFSLVEAGQTLGHEDLHRRLVELYNKTIDSRLLDRPKLYTPHLARTRQSIADKLAEIGDVERALYIYSIDRNEDKYLAMRLCEVLIAHGDWQRALDFYFQHRRTFNELVRQAATIEAHHLGLWLQILTDCADLYAPHSDDWAKVARILRSA
ncbi:MAG: hypothetical protein AAF125_11235, partial [Chloroflexota bacterium]